MKTGIIRTVDDLGRIVIPKEIRHSLGIVENDPLEISVTEEGVLLTKYVPGNEVEKAADALGSILKNNVNELDKKEKDAIAKKLQGILSLIEDIVAAEKIRAGGHPIKETICLSSDEFEKILKKIYPHGFETEYSMDGLWVGNKYGELPVEEDLTEYFNRKVSSIHLDDCDCVGVWIVFAE